MAFEALGAAAIAAEDERVLSPELTTGEKLLWAGHPAPGLRFGGFDLIAVPFALFWLGAVMFGVRALIKQEAPPFAFVFLSCFVLVGLYMVVGRFWVDSARRHRTTYGLSATRLILVSRFLVREVQSIDIASLDTILLNERRDRSGTITLGAVTDSRTRTAMLLGPAWPGVRPYLPLMLENVEDARVVYQKIRALRVAAAGGQGAWG